MKLYKFTKTLVLLTCVPLLSNCKKSAGTQETKPPTQNVFIDLAYANGSAAQKLDLFLPDTPKAQNPVLIWVHGGGWKSGDKAEFRSTDKLKSLRKRGYAVVVINYRLSGEAKFPAQIQDVKAAIRWVKANAAAYTLQPDKIGLWGSSAGGHLVALAGSSGDITALEDKSMGNSSFSSRVQAVIDWYGPTDLMKMDSMAIAQGCPSSHHSDANSPESEMIGAPVTASPDIVRSLNPITYISSDDPPFYIEHGLSDCTVSYGQSQLLYAALVPVIGNQNCQLHLLENTGHGGGLFSNAETVNKAIDFLDSRLK